MTTSVEHAGFQSPRWPTGRCQAWRLRTRTLRFATGPAWMGIVNVTPDSFSDGGRFFDPARAIAQAEDLLNQGADILDIGGESTRPYSQPVTEAEELQRVLPVIEAVRQRHADAIISVDTSKPGVAAAAIAAGAEIVNDITGLTNLAMIELARATQAGVCAMHMQGTPQTMQVEPRYDDVIGEIHAYLRERRDVLLSAGLAPEQICLDPGIGFGKTHAHNLKLMQSCWRFHDLGPPLLVGHSRKGFIGQVLGDKEADRDAGSLGGALALALQGVQVIRLHQIRAAKEAWQVMRASLPELTA